MTARTLLAWALALASGLMLLSGLAAAADVPTGRIVAEVVPLDLKSVEPDYVRNLMHTRPGKPYDDATVNDDVRRLLNTQLFVPGSVSVSTAFTNDGRVTVFVRARELTGVVQEVKFYGAQHFSVDELVDLSQIRRGGPMNPSANQLARASILNKLRDEGRYYASVEILEGTKITDNRVVFQIVEGPIVRVLSVQFRGNSYASTGRLKTQIVTGSALFPGITTPLSPKLQPASIDEDKKKLLEYYHRIGHIDAMVKEDIVPSTNDISAVNVVYHIHEGRPYKVRDVKITGSKTFNENRLRKVTEMRGGEGYNSDIVRADEKRLEMLSGNAGVKTMVATEKYVVPGEPGLVDVHYHVVEQNRAPVKIGRIIIVGNTVTRQETILNELGLYPGQVLQYPQLEQARFNLMRRNIFDNVDDPPRVEAIPNEFDSEFQDIRVTVKETGTGMFAIQANVNSDAGVNGSIVLNQRNFDILRVPTSLDDLFSGKAFTGAGQEFRAEAMPGNIFQRYAVTWREPYLFDSNYGLSVSGYYFNRAFAEYHEDRYGIRAGIDYRFTDSNIWRASFTTRLEGVSVSDVPNWATPAITNDIGQSTLLGLRLGVTRDTRDNILMPTTGSVLDIGFEQVLGDYTFPIGTIEASKYITTWERKDGSGRHVLAARTQLTGMANNAPVFERVYAGGIRSFRGFSFRGMGPNENYLNVGGNFGFINNLEYLIPVLANDKLYFAAFVDHGTVERDFAIRDYRVSVGVGLRISVPALGPLPIALDFGVPIVKGPFDNKQVFQFSMGWGFGQ
ncbi:MAG: outer membrane protein assembly factor BamA [Fimbriiglobus sp.]